MAGVVGWTIPDEYRIHTRWCFGLENHMKGIPDGIIGELANIRRRCRTLKVLQSLEDRNKGIKKKIAITKNNIAIKQKHCHPKKKHSHPKTKHGNHKKHSH